MEVDTSVMIIWYCHGILLRQHSYEYLDSVIKSSWMYMHDKKMTYCDKHVSSQKCIFCSVDIHMFSTNCKVQAKFEEWFLSPALDHLEELNFEAG